MFSSDHDHPDEGFKQTILNAKANALAENLGNQQAVQERIGTIRAAHRQHCDGAAGLTPVERQAVRPILHSCVSEIVRARRDLSHLRREYQTVRGQMLRESVMTPRQLQLRLPKAPTKKPTKAPKGGV